MRHADRAVKRAVVATVGVPAAVCMLSSPGELPVLVNNYPQSDSDITPLCKGAAVVSGARAAHGHNKMEEHVYAVAGLCIAVLLALLWMGWDLKTVQQPRRAAQLNTKQRRMDKLA